MKKLFTVVLACLFIFSAMGAYAQKQPCSGKMGGIDKCVGSQFLCNNGKISKSRRSCEEYMKGVDAKVKYVRNLPCSGKMGGIDKCVGTKFLCNNGEYSRSKRSCEKYMNTTSDNSKKSNKKQKRIKREQ